MGKDRPVITLLTDFGLTDGCVGAMKGVLATQAPHAAIVDLSHEIAPFDVQSAGYVLASAAYEFPRGTIHVAVVDPGVGGRRRIVLAESDGQRLLAPDNGLLDVCRLRHAVQRWFHVTRVPAMRRAIAPTFHGRDLFAPAAAALVRGVTPSHLGPRLASVPFRLGIRPAHQRGRQVRGQVLHVDRFGTLITTIDTQALHGLRSRRHWCVRLGGRTVRRWVRTYAEASPGALVALWGSQGWLEISVVEGSAAALMRVGRGAPVIVEAA